MTKNTTLPIFFNNSLKIDFSKTLNKRVNSYFKRNNISKHANVEMVVKTFVMLSLYFVPYAFNLSGLYDSLWIYFGVQIIMGLGLAGIGLSIMHDANHGAYSKHPWVNKWVGYTLNLVGGNATNWKIQHNVKHHSFTNVDGYDEDVEPKGNVLRFSPNIKRRKFHRYQIYYAWFLYGFMSFVWIVFKDFKQMFEYTRDGYLEKQQPVVKAWIWLLITKINYYTYIFVLPILFSPFSWGTILLGFVVMHYVAGFILAMVFQPAHIIEGNDFPVPNDKGVVEENWMVHQLKTTCNFANKNRWLSWYVGGLNFQIEHHLFPNICHVHYKKLSNIVHKTAKEFSVPYYSFPTFRAAIIAHAKTLYHLGKYDNFKVST